MSPVITVLMPVYNAESYVAEAIQSILDQSFADFELLIVDDGSTDGSMDIVDDFEDSRIRVLTHSMNRGLVTALNHGINEARGTYIARMDADDISLPSRLGLQHDFLQRNPTYAMCGTAVHVIGSKEIWRQPVFSQEVRCELLFRCCFAHPTVMIRRHVLTTFNLFYDSKFEPAEDYDLWVRMSREFLLTNLPVPLLRYRLHEHQVSQVRDMEQRSRVRDFHRQQLAMLGIEPTESELNLHYNPWLHFGSEELKAWLEKLLKANERHHIYPHSAFCSVILKYDPTLRPTD